MHVGVCTISSKDRSIESVLDVCGGLDIHGVEIWGRDHVGDRSPARCRGIAATAEANGLSIPVYGSYLRPGGSRFDDEVVRELEVARHLDADMIRVWAGEQEYQNCDDDHWEDVLVDLRRLADAARDRDLMVTVERHSGTVTNTTDGARTLIEEVDSPIVGLNWQPLFEHDAGTVLADARRLAPVTNNVHLQSVLTPRTGDRCALVDAYFDAAGVVEMFDKYGFDGYLEIEFVPDTAPYPAALASDVAFVRSLL